MRVPSEASLPLLLRSLSLTTMAREAPAVIESATREGRSHEGLLLELVRLELAARATRRVERLLAESKLPRDKTLSSFDMSRFSAKVRGQVSLLVDPSLLERSVNVLVFGNPGAGKTHLAAALGQEWARAGRPVLFTPTYRLVQRLLAAKRDLRLAAELKRLDRFEAIILDDIGYVQQSREEMDVLFTLIAERYERRSIVVTSNLVFSKWDQIFKDSMTTAAAIDRLIHHAEVIELTLDSYRREAARQRAARPAKASAGTT